MKASQFIGHGAEVEHLMRSVQAGRIVHACILAGPRGGGKRALANLLVGAVFCREQNLSDRPCGVCPACKRVLGGTHPDIRRLTPEGRSIGVDEVRKLIDFLANKPYEGGYHAAVIEEAEKMTPSAQNALLKTLEEPGGDALILLLTESPGALLPTIRSRCRLVRVPRLTPELCREALEERGVEGERADAAARLSDGSVGRALEMLEDEGYIALRERVCRSLNLLKGPENVAEAASLIGMESARAREVLEILELLARGRLAEEASLVPLAPTPEPVCLDGQAMLEGAMRLREMLASNVSWINALEYYYFSLVGES